MKVVLLAFASSMLAAEAFVLVPPRMIGMVQRSSTPTNRRAAVLHSSMESDFASAMPAQPEATSFDRLRSSGNDFATGTRSYLADGVPAPPELVALEDALESNADEKVLAGRIYELMIEIGMIYDKEPETGILTPTEYDIKANLDVLEVKQEFFYLYKYGMSVIQRGLIDLEEAKAIIQDRLVARTGLSPEEFDKWLGF
jgi:hypothetical protein